MSVGVTAAQLQAELSVDSSGFDSGLASAEQALTSIASATTSAFTRIEEAVTSSLQAALGTIREFASQAGSALESISKGASGAQESILGVGVAANLAREALSSMANVSSNSLKKLGTNAEVAALGLEKIAPAATVAESAISSLAGGAVVLGELRAGGLGVGRSFRAMGKAAEGATTSVNDLFARVEAGASTAAGAAAGAASAVKSVGSSARQAASTGAGGFSAMSMKLMGMGMVSSMVGAQMSRLGHDILGAIEGAVSKGNEWALTLQQVAANTSMTVDETAAMKKTVEDLGATTAAPLKQLAEGWMHAVNNGLAAREIPPVLEEAARSAVATGGQVARTTDMLTSALHNFHLNAATDSKRTMAVLHEAAVQGNQTLEQFVAGSVKARASAATYGQSLVETAAALATMTRAGYTAAMASTAYSGMIDNIVKPTQAASKVIGYLQGRLKAMHSNIDLFHDFTPAGAAVRHFTGVLSDLQRTSDLTHISMQKLLDDLFTGQRGRRMADVLAGNNKADMSQILGSIQAQWSGTGPDRIGADYARAMKEANNQIALFQNNLTLLAGDVASVVMPALQPIIKWADEAAKWFRGLSPTVKEVTVGLAAFAGVALTVGGTILSFVGSLASMAAMASIAGVSLTGVTGVLGGVGAVLTGPVGLAIAGAVVAIGGLVYAFHQVSDAGVKSYEEMRAASIANAQHAESAARNADSVFTLTEKIHSLEQILHPTAAQANLLQDCLDRLSVLSPDLVTGYDNQGHALGVVAGAFDHAASAAVNYTREARIASAQTAALQAVQLAQQKSDISDRLQHLRAQGGRQHYWGHPEGGGVYQEIDRPDTAQEASTRAALDRQLQSQIADLSRQQPAANETVRELLHPILGPPAELAGKANAAGKNLGNAFDDGLDAALKKHKHKSGKGALKEMQKDAEETAKAIKDALHDIFDMQHAGDDAAIKRRDARDQRQEDKDSGVPQGIRDKRYNLSMGAAAKDAHKAVEEAAKEMGGSIADAFKEAGAAAGEFWEKQDQLADQTREYLLQSNKVSLQDYLGYLKAKEAGYAVDSLAYIDMEGKILTVTKQIDDAMSEAAKKSEEATRKAGSAFGEAMSKNLKAVAEQQQKEAALYKFEFDHAEISAAQYRAYLQQRIAALTPYTEAWKKATDELTAFNQSAADASQKAWDEFMKKMDTAIKKQQDGVKGVADSITGVLINALSNLHGSFRNFFNNVSVGFQQMVQRMALDWIQSQLQKMIQSGINSLIGAVGSGGLGGLFGGGGSQSPFTATAQTIGTMAAGGDIDSGRSYLVGENGPELITSRGAGTVINNSTLQQLAGSGGGNTTIHVHVHGATNPSAFKATEAQIGNRIAQQLELSRRRNG